MKSTTAANTLLMSDALQITHAVDSPTPEVLAGVVGLKLDTTDRQLPSQQSPPLRSLQIRSASHQKRGDIRLRPGLNGDGRPQSPKSLTILNFSGASSVPSPNGKDTNKAMESSSPTASLPIKSYQAFVVTQREEEFSSDEENDSYRKKTKTTKSQWSGFPSDLAFGDHIPVVLPLVEGYRLKVADDPSEEPAKLSKADNKEKIHHRRLSKETHTIMETVLAEEKARKAHHEDIYIITSKSTLFPGRSSTADKKDSVKGNSKKEVHASEFESSKHSDRRGRDPVIRSPVPGGTLKSDIHFAEINSPSNLHDYQFPHVDDAATVTSGDSDFKQKLYASKIISKRGKKVSTPLYSPALFRVPKPLPEHFDDVEDDSSPHNPPGSLPLGAGDAAGLTSHSHKEEVPHSSYEPNIHSENEAGFLQRNLEMTAKGSAQFDYDASLTTPGVSMHKNFTEMAPSILRGRQTPKKYAPYFEELERIQFQHNRPNSNLKKVAGSRPSSGNIIVRENHVHP